MGIKVVGLMHTGIRVAPKDKDIEAALDVWSDLLGLKVDANRPHIPVIPGAWLNLNDGEHSQQIHVFGAEGESPVARSPKEDPTRAHVAFVVEDLEEAKRELDGRQIEFWIYAGLVGSGSEQVFFEDGFGNMIELQQAPG